MSIKKMLAHVSLFTVLVAVTVISIGNVYAADEAVTPNSGTPSTYKHVGYGSIEQKLSPQSYKYLSKGTSEIRNLGSGEIYTAATTTAKMSIESVGVTIILQQYKGGKWVDYSVLGSKSSSRSSSVTYSTTTTVPTGYNYRVKATHWAIHDGKNEQDNSVTSYIHID